MTLDFHDAVRAETQLLILLAGGTGTGKTESALRLATGIANGGQIVAIDTERGRMLHKADDYTFKHAELEPPFTPERYVEAIKDAEKLNPAVLIIDSGSHEYEGEGGVQELQLQEHQRLGGGENTKLLSWSVPKQRHRKYRDALVRARPHVIVCHRAEDKVDLVKNERTGRTEVVKKASFTGTDGWIPICERRLPFEATISLVLTPEKPGVPLPVKLERRHAELVPLDEQLSEETGARLAAWAAGSASAPARGPAGTSDADDDPGTGGDGPSREEALEERRVTLTAELLEFAKAKNMLADGERWVEENRHLNKGAPAKHLVWLEEQIKIAKRNAQAAA